MVDFFLLSCIHSLLSVHATSPRGLFGGLVQHVSSALLAFKKLPDVSFMFVFAFILRVLLHLIFPRSHHLSSVCLHSQAPRQSENIGVFPCVLLHKAHLTAPQCGREPNHDHQHYNTSTKRHDTGVLPRTSAVCVHGSVHFFRLRFFLVLHLWWHSKIGTLAAALRSLWLVCSLLLGLSPLISRSKCVEDWDPPLAVPTLVHLVSCSLRLMFSSCLAAALTLRAAVTNLLSALAQHQSAISLRRGVLIPSAVRVRLVVPSALQLGWSLPLVRAQCQPVSDLGKKVPLRLFLSRFPSHVWPCARPFARLPLGSLCGVAASHHHSLSPIGRIALLTCVVPPSGSRIPYLDAVLSAASDIVYKTCLSLWFGLGWCAVVAFPQHPSFQKMMPPP